MKKRLYGILSFVLAFFVLFGACNSGGTNSSVDTGSDSESSLDSSSTSGVIPEDEYMLERGENEKQLTIYYHRDAGYENCDIWMIG